MVSRETYKTLDDLFDVNLRPLRSLSARRIFVLFVEHGIGKQLTTLDIQTKLESLDINLDKKEINGWLMGLLSAGLIQKEVLRGKPTTLKYEDRYTFDLWRITSLGLRIAENLPMVTRSNFLIIEDDAINIFKKLAKEGDAIRDITVKRLQDLSLFIWILGILFKNKKSISEEDLLDKLRIGNDELYRIVSTYPVEKEEEPMIIRRVKKNGIKGSLLRMFGISGQSEYHLSAEGKKIAQLLFSEVVKDIDDIHTFET